MGTFGRIAGIAALIAVSQTSVGAPTRWEPDVVFSAGSIVGMPASVHHVLSQKMELVESQGCAAQVSGGSVRVPESCGFLRGLYRYTFAGDGGAEREIVLEFDLTRHAGGHVFLLAAPFELPAS